MRKKPRRPKPHPQAIATPVVDLAIGDCIVVKPGIKDPDSGADIGGWQGRVFEIKSYQPGKVTISFHWDTLSLKCMPAAAIRRYEEDGLDWTTMGLYPEEVERAEPRDTPQEVAVLIEKLTAEHAWDYMGEQGERIHQVLRDVGDGGELAAFAAWQTYLKAHLTLPFEAVVSEAQNRSPLHFGDRLKVVGFEDFDDSYGVLAKVKAGWHSYAIPLCDLKALDEESANYTMTDDYAVWYANR